MTSLKIGKDLKLPIDVVTWTLAILARKGAGKTYLASVIAEEMVAAGLPFVVLDPTGAWWGLRASADGKGPGLPVVIIGGDHGDIPLEPGAGQVIADLVVDHPGYYVIDFSLTNSDAEQLRFASDFFSRIYRRKGSIKYRDPLMIWVDEADGFAPQQPMREEITCLHHIKTATRRGRGRGIGVGLISQRSAELNKGVLTQAEALIVLQTTGPQDQDAIELWVKRHGTVEQRADFMKSLSSLQKGDAWIWHPTSDIKLKRFRARPRKTFNSSATPEVGARRIEPKQLAKVDLEKIKGQVAATIERAKAEDPRTLKAQIAELQRKVKAAPIPVAAKIEIKEIPVITDTQFKQLEKTADKVAASLKRLIESSASVKEAVNALETISSHIYTTAHTKSIIKNELSLIRQRAFTPPPAARPLNPSSVPLKTPKTGPQGSSGNLPAGERKILTALAQYPEGRTAVQVAVLIGYAHKGGGFRNYLGALRSKGYVAGNRDHLKITDSGLAALGAFTPLPSGSDLLEHWRGQLSKAERAALDAVIKVYPHSLPVESVAEQSGYQAGGGGFRNALGRLRSLELIHGYRELKASDTLFD